MSRPSALPPSSARPLSRTALRRAPVNAGARIRCLERTAEFPFLLRAESSHFRGVHARTFDQIAQVAGMPSRTSGYSCECVHDKNEVYYDNQWRFFHSYGEALIHRPDQLIPPFENLRRHPDLLTSGGAYIQTISGIDGALHWRSIYRCKGFNLHVRASVLRVTAASEFLTDASATAGLASLRRQKPQPDMSPAKGEPLTTAIVVFARLANLACALEDDLYEIKLRDKASKDVAVKCAGKRRSRKRACFTGKANVERDD